MIVFLLKGYPRLSETFIAQEIEALERRGLQIAIVSLRRPNDAQQHPIHANIRAPIHYLPEYLHNEIGRVWRALVRQWSRLRPVWRLFLTDFLRHPSRNTLRRLGQAVVLVDELPAILGTQSARQLHAHFLHSPSSVARYASHMTGLDWSASAHAKDIWTTRPDELVMKLREVDWVTCCTQAGFDYLRALAPEARLVLARHGLDLAAIPDTPPNRISNSDTNRPIILLCVARLVAKKGHSDLFAALHKLADSVPDWRLILIGGGELQARLQRQAQRLRLNERIEWRGACSRDAVFAAYGEADLFVLPCREGEKGDRDGLPNVLLEAMSQSLCCLTSDFAATSEFITHHETGWLARHGDVDNLAAGLSQLMATPALRRRLGEAGHAHVQAHGSMEPGIKMLHELFTRGWPCESLSMRP